MRIQPIRKTLNDCTIETWYDRHTRSWVCQLKDEQGNQLGDAEYNGTKAGVPLSIAFLENRAFNRFAVVVK